MEIQLSVIIVNYNGLHFLNECLNSLKDKLKLVTYEIIILDNNSQDDSCSYIRKQYPEVQLIASKVNYGFGKGNNEAVKFAKGKYLLLFNNDTILLDELSPIIQLIENDKKIGVVGIKMLNATNEYIPAAGNFPSVRNMFRFVNLLDVGSEFKSGSFSKQYYEVDWLAGSFLLLTKNTFNKIGGFDEDYFMYVEDVDFCKKIADAGLKRVFYPGLSYNHFVGFSRKKNPLLVKGYRIYIKKHFKGLSFYVVSIALSINSTVKMIKSAF